MLSGVDQAGPGEAPAPVLGAGPARSGLRFGALLRVAFSVAVVALCLRLVPGGEVLEVLRQSRWGPFLLGCLALLAGNLVSAWKCSRVLSALGGTPGDAFCAKVYLQGFFFNQVLPMGSGDVQRFVALGRATGRWVAVGSALFWERWTGLQALILLGGAAVLAAPPPFGSPAGALVAGSAMLGMLGATAVAVGLGRGGAAWSRRLPVVGPRLQPLEAMLQAARPPTALLATLSLASLVQPLLGTLFYGCVFAACGWHLAGAQALAVTAYVTLAIQVPLFVNGLGIQEAALLALGVAPPAQVLSASLLAHLGRTLVSLVGGAALLVDLSPLGAGRPEVEAEP